MVDSGWTASESADADQAFKQLMPTLSSDQNDTSRALMVITDASSERKDHMQKLVSALPSSSRNILTRVSVLHLVSDIDPEAPLQSSQVSSMLQLSLVRCHAATLRQNLLSLCFKDWGMAFYRVGNMLFYGRQLAVEKKEVYRFDEIESVHETMADGVGDDVRVLLSSNNSASETIKSGTYLVIRLAADQLYTLHTHANDASTFILQPKRAHPQPSIAPTSTPAPPMASSRYVQIRPLQLRQISRTHQTPPRTRTLLHQRRHGRLTTRHLPHTTRPIKKVRR